MDAQTKIDELEEAIKDAWEGLTRIGRLLDQGNTLVARQFAGEIRDDLMTALALTPRHVSPLGCEPVPSAAMPDPLTRPPAQWTDEQKRHLGLLGIVPTAYMDERLTRLLAIVGELYVRWEPGAATPEERAIYHEAARLLFQFHPCERCRVFWSDRGYACPDHRVALGAVPR